MKTIIPLFKLLFFIFILSCKSHDVYLTDAFTDIQNVDLEKLDEYPNDSIGSPSHILCTKDYIILVEPELEYLLSAYHTKKHTFSRFLSKGRGPDEMMDIQQINSCRQSDNDFCVMHTFGNMSFIFSPTDSTYQIVKKISLPENSSTFTFDHNLIIGVLNKEKKHFYLRTADSTLVPFGNFPPINNLSPEIISELTDGYCTNSSKHKKFIWFSIFGDIFELYDYHDITNPSLVHQHMAMLPIFSLKKIRGEDHVAFSQETKIGVVSLTSSDDYIFALYNQNTFKDIAKLKDDIFFSRQILIYNWDGLPIKILNLNEKVKAISFDKTNNCLYGIACDEHGPKILYKNLTNIL